LDDIFLFHGFCSPHPLESKFCAIFSLNFDRLLDVEKNVVKK